MTQKKGWGSTVAGWFIVQDPTTASARRLQPLFRRLRRRLHPSSAPPPPPLDVFKTAPPEAPGGQVDFDNVFEAAGIDAEERERVTPHALRCSTDLPPGTDDTVKKQIVMASLRAFNVPVEKIIESRRAGAAGARGVHPRRRLRRRKGRHEADLRIKQHEDEIAKLRS